MNHPSGSAASASAHAAARKSESSKRAPASRPTETRPDWTSADSSPAATRRKCSANRRSASSMPSAMKLMSAFSLNSLTVLLQHLHRDPSCKGLIVRCAGDEPNTNQSSGILIEPVDNRLARVLVTPTDEDTPVPSKQPPDNAAPTTLRRLRVDPDGFAVAQNLASECVVHHVSHGPVASCHLPQLRGEGAKSGGGGETFGGYRPNAIPRHDWPDTRLSLSPPPLVHHCRVVQAEDRPSIWQRSLSLGPRGVEGVGERSVGCIEEQFRLRWFRTQREFLIDIARVPNLLCHAMPQVSHLPVLAQHSNRPVTSDRSATWYGHRRTSRSVAAPLSHPPRR